MEQKVTGMIVKMVEGMSQNVILEVMLNRPGAVHIPGSYTISEDMEDISAIQSNPGVNPGYCVLALTEYSMDQIPAKNASMEELKLASGNTDFTEK